MDVQDIPFDMESLVQELSGLADPEYRDFNTALIPGVSTPSLGIRVPVLRELGRRLMRSDWQSFLDKSRHYPLFEVQMLHAIVLGGARRPIDEKIPLLDAFLPVVDNWAVCDTLCNSLKPKPADKDALFRFVCICADSGQEFRKRFGLVMMMNRYQNLCSQ